MANTECSLAESSLHELEALAISAPLQVYKYEAGASGSSAYINSAIKRSLDIIVAGALLIALMPLLLLVFACIKLTSDGPAVFRQARTGFGGATFSIYKFRTMYVSEESAHALLQTKRGDPRVTVIGHFLRRTSIDELPQLWNVLLGEMSLVGPRPHACQHDEQFLFELPEYSQRFVAKPGITGLAQVSGSRGAIESNQALQTRLDLDLEYIKTADILLDFKLLAISLSEIFLSKGAF